MATLRGLVEKEVLLDQPLYKHWMLEHDFLHREHHALALLLPYLLCKLLAEWYVNG